MNFENKLIKILIIFFISYFVLFGLYQGYLHYYNSVLNTVDPFTKFMASIATQLLNATGFNTQVVHPENADYVWLYIDNQYTTRVNEGCNGLSIGIFMISFLLAFHTNFKQTMLYTLIFLAILFLLNIIRIETLSYIYRFENQRFKMAHDVVFPILIYGFVVLAWMVWLGYFALKNKNVTKVSE